MLSACNNLSFYLLIQDPIAFRGNCRHPIPSITPKLISLKFSECFKYFWAESMTKMLFGLLFIWLKFSLWRRQQKRLCGTAQSFVFQKNFLISVSLNSCILEMIAGSQRTDEMLAMFQTNFLPLFSLSMTRITMAYDPVCPMFTILRPHLQMVIESHSPLQLSVGLSCRYSPQLSLK